MSRNSKSGNTFYLYFLCVLTSFECCLLPHCHSFFQISGVQLQLGTVRIKEVDNPTQSPFHRTSHHRNFGSLQYSYSIVNLSPKWRKRYDPRRAPDSFLLLFRLFQSGKSRQFPIPGRHLSFHGERAAFPIHSGRSSRTVPDSLPGWFMVQSGHLHSQPAFVLLILLKDMPHN